MTEPRITVIIPTRERCETLEKSLLTVAKQSYENLDIIVSDNFSKDRTKDVVLAISDSRVRYLNTQRRVSMSENWEFALSHVDEGWVTIIGDDDGLLPESVSRVASIINSTDTKAIRSAVCAYFWPSAIGKEHGRLAVPMQSGHEDRSAAEWLTKVLEGKAAYQQLPMLYNGGYVDVSVLKEIKIKTGYFYQSCVPDIYSAISVTSMIDRYVYCREPLAINGASKHSTGTSYFSTKGGASGTPAQLFASEGNLPFHSDFPVCSGAQSLSIQALIYESYLQSAGLRATASDNMHIKMLRIILATAGPYKAIVEDWGKQFALMHRLDFSSISREAKYLEMWLGINAVPLMISTAMNKFVIDSREYPIRDVYEASILAEAVRNAEHSQIGKIWHLFRRTFDVAKLRLIQ